VNLFTPDEIVRIEELRVVDPEDVPSVTLALVLVLVLVLVLGAFYLSDDKRALRAVYGAAADLWRHGELLDLLRAGGDAGNSGSPGRTRVQGDAHGWRLEPPGRSSGDRAAQTVSHLGPETCFRTDRPIAEWTPSDRLDEA